MIFTFQVVQKKYLCREKKKSKCGKNVNFKSRRWVAVFIKQFFTSSFYSQTHGVSSTLGPPLSVGQRSSFLLLGTDHVLPQLGPRGTSCCYLGAWKRPTFKLQTHSQVTLEPQVTEAASADLPPAPKLWGKGSCRAQQNRWWSCLHDLSCFSLSLFWAGWGECKGLVISEHQRS